MGIELNDTGLVIPAAGRGERLELDTAKALLDLDGVPMIVRTLRLFEPFGLLRRAVVVAPAGGVDTVRSAVATFFPEPGGIDVVEGGESRQQSVLNGLHAIADDTQIVAIHDAARPFTAPETISQCIAGAREHGAAIAAVPTVDTIVEVGQDGTVAETLDRNRLWAVQTPQVFSYRLILDAHRQAADEGFVATDDAALVMRAGHSVHVAMGSYDNIKITVPRDLVIAGQILRQQCYT